MEFDIKNKVCIVTGGASGIGLEFVRHLLKEEAKGIVIADIDRDGEQVAERLRNEFNMDRIVFVETDVTASKSFENAFKVTVEKYGNIDILINNAGVNCDSEWEKEVDVNVKGVLNGMLLGMENYLRHHKQDKEAVILNVGSAVILAPLSAMPVYTATKFAVFGFTKSWGSPGHYLRTKVRVLGLCPGMTETPIVQKLSLINSEYFKLFSSDTISLKIQSVEFLAQETMKIIKKGSNGSVWIVEDYEPAYEYNMPPNSNFKNNTLN